MTVVFDMDTDSEAVGVNETESDKEWLMDRDSSGVIVDDAVGLAEVDKDTVWDKDTEKVSLQEMELVIDNVSS